MWVVQNAGIAGANLAAGWLNDQAGASALNPAGYEPMMRFFGVSSAMGFLFAIMLWLTAGRRRHEASLSRAGTASTRVPASGVRREKAALFQWVQAPPGDCSSRKQPEQRWR